MDLNYLSFASAGVLTLSMLVLGFGAPPASHAIFPTERDTLETVDSVAALADTTSIASVVDRTMFVSHGREVEVTHAIGEGAASYYGSELAGRPTASGERFDPEKLTAAHPHLPFGTRLLVTNLRNGQSVIVRINDRGPFSGRRVLDLSYAAAKAIGMIRRGTARVKMEVLR